MRGVGRAPTGPLYFRWMTRTIVTFEAPQTTFPVAPGTEGEPAGREVAQFVSSALREAGVPHRGPEDRGGWAWQLVSDGEHGSVECIVGLVDDAPRQWQIVTDVRARRRLLRSSRAEAEAASARARDQVIAAVNDAIGSRPGITSVRWYDQDDFDRDHGETWSASPFV